VIWIDGTKSIIDSPRRSHTETMSGSSERLLRAGREPMR